MTSLVAAKAGRRYLMKDIVTILLDATALMMDSQKYDQG